MDKSRYSNQLKSSSQKRGSLLILALLITVILVIVGYALTSTIGIEGQHAAIAEYSAESLYAADAGIQFTIAELIHGQPITISTSPYPKTVQFRIIGVCWSGPSTPTCSAKNVCCPGGSCCWGSPPQTPPTKCPGGASPPCQCSTYPPPFSNPNPSQSSPMCGCPVGAPFCTYWPNSPIANLAGCNYNLKSPAEIGSISCTVNDSGHIDQYFVIHVKGYQGGLGSCASHTANTWCYQVRSTGTVETDNTSYIYSQRVLKAYLSLNYSTNKVTIINEYEDFR
jgi:hypothetical protein